MWMPPVVCNSLRLRAAAAAIGVGLVLRCPDTALARLQPRVDVWTADRGLPSNSVFSIAQTSDGYMWFGTGVGLAKFDGARFVIYDDRTTPALQEGNVVALLPAPDGTLWIGLDGGGLVQARGGLVRSGRRHRSTTPALRTRR